MTRISGWRRVGAVAVLAGTLAVAGAARAGEAEDAATIKHLLESAHITYKPTKSPTVFTADYTGKTIGSMKVIIAVQGDLVVIFTNPMRKGQFATSQEALYKMARMNHEFDFVKVEIDDDGDFAVRADIDSGATPAQFKRICDQVAASTNEAYETMAPYRIASGK